VLPALKKHAPISFRVGIGKSTDVAADHTAVHRANPIGSAGMTAATAILVQRLAALSLPRCRVERKLIQHLLGRACAEITDS
jgi:hypothetical protein